MDQQILTAAEAQGRVEEETFGPTDHLAAVVLRMHPKLRERVNELAYQRRQSTNVLIRELILQEVLNAGSV